MLQIEDAPREGPVEQVSGRIGNTGDEPITGIYTYVAYFDEDGIFIGHCIGSGALTGDVVIPPGKAVRFRAGGGSCGNTNTGRAPRGGSGPETQRIILVRH